MTAPTIQQPRRPQEEGLRDHIRRRRAALAGFLEQGATLALEGDLLRVIPLNDIYIRYLNDNRASIGALASEFYGRPIRVEVAIVANGDGAEPAQSPNRCEEATPTPKPKALPPVLDAIPTRLTARAQWVLWRYVWDAKGKGGGKWTKPPFQPNGALASSTNPETWSSFETVVAAYQRGGWEGIGYALAPDDLLFGVDIDHCYDPATKTVAPWAQGLLELVASYTEISPSGTGLRVFAQGALPDTGHKKGGLGPDGTGVLEVYDKGRYLTVTGHHLPGSPATIIACQPALDELLAKYFPKPEPQKPRRANTETLNLDDSVILDIARRAKNGSDFSALYDRGDLSAHHDDHSAADLALLHHLLFYSQGNTAQAERLFSSSALGERSKWDRSDYRARTIDKALSGMTEFYAPSVRDEFEITGNDEENAERARAHADYEPSRNGQGSAKNGAGKGLRAKIEIPEWPDPDPLIPPLPDVLEITDDLIPEPLRAWASDIAEYAGAPLAVPYAAIMAELSSVIGRKIGIRPKRHDLDFIVAPVIWSLVIGASGMLKSPPMNSAMRPLRRLAVDSSRNFISAHPMWEEEHRAWEKRKSLAESKEQEFKEPEPEEPTERRYIVNDSTVQKLGMIVKENPNGFLFYRDEFSAFFRGLERKGHETDRQFFMEAWHGTKAFSYDTLSRGSVHLPPLFIAMTGSITPGPLTAYMRDVFGEGREDDGLMQRFQLAVWPDPLKSGVGKDTPRNDSTYPKVLELFRTLDNMLVRDRLDPQIDPHDPDGMPYVGFSAAAQEIMNQYFRELDEKSRDIDEHPALTSHFAKYKSLLPALALIHHLCEHAGGKATSKPVSLEAITVARKTCKVLATHALRVYSPLSRRRPSERKADALYKKILKGEIAGPIKTREIQRAHPTIFENAEIIEAALTDLAKRGVVAPRPLSTGARRGPQKTTVYDINPRVLRGQQNDRAGTR